MKRFILNQLLKAILVVLVSALQLHFILLLQLMFQLLQHVPFLYSESFHDVQQKPNRSWQNKPKLYLALFTGEMAPNLSNTYPRTLIFIPECNLFSPRVSFRPDLKNVSAHMRISSRPEISDRPEQPKRIQVDLSFISPSLM